MDTRLRSIVLILTILVMAGLAWPGASYAQTADDHFMPETDGMVFALLAQPDGKILVGGSFTTLGGLPRINIGRVLTDGSVDMEFSASTGAGASILCLALQADGKILVGGTFSSLSGRAAQNLGRLNYDGSLDQSFAPNPDAMVTVTVAQPDGKILIGGRFQTLGGQAHPFIGRLNADGTVDATFNPPAFNADVTALALRADGKIMVGGVFHTVDGQARQHLARLNANGSLDTTFGAGTDGTIASLAIQPDGGIIVGGQFDALAGHPRSNLGRLNADGAVDTSFNPGASGGADSIYTLAVQADGKILVGGDFTTLGDVPRTRLGRLNSDGAIDNTFYTVNGASGPIYSLAIQPDNKILVGGNFVNLGGSARTGIGRLYPDGRVDQSLHPEATGNDVYALALQPNSDIVVGGHYTGLAGQLVYRIGRVYNDGNLDTALNPTANGRVYSAVMQPDGKIVIGGQFSTIGPAPHSRLARINADGTVDATFTASADATVFCLALQADGKILVGGSFTNLNGQHVPGFGRLNADGSLETTAPPLPFGGIVYAIAVQPDGKILMGGDFVMPVAHLARLETNCHYDQTFNSDGIMGKIYTILVQPDGKIIIGGNFTTVHYQTRNHIARLYSDGSLDGLFDPNVSSNIYTMALQTDGRILIGGSFNAVGVYAISRLGRLNTDGSLDINFYGRALGDNLSVYAISIQDDGKILVGGGFNDLNFLPRTHIGRLATTNAALQNLRVDDSGATITWLRSGPSPEVSRVTFEQSGDGAAWTMLGAGTRTNNGWQLTGLALPTAVNGYVRARGFSIGGIYSGSGSIIESTRLFWLLPPPADVAASAGTYGDGIHVTWTPSEQAAGYEIWRSTNNQAAAATRIGGTTNTMYVDTSASRWINYYYWVKATNLFAVSSFSLPDTGWRKTIPERICADYDGDGMADPAVYDEATATWLVRLSSAAYLLIAVPNLLGGQGYATTAADYDGDRLADPAVYQEQTGNWIVLMSSGNYLQIERDALLGGVGSLAVGADYDGDAKADPAVYTESNGYWQVLLSSAGYFAVMATVFDDAGLMPVPADYDGDRLADPAVYQEATGDWTAFLSSAGYLRIPAPALLGGAGWLPVPADYDGDAKADPAVMNPDTGEWQARLSSANYLLVTASLTF